MTQNKLYTEIMQAVTRGWCYPNTEKKVMDVDLATSISAELLNFINTHVRKVVGKDDDLELVDSDPEGHYMSNLRPEELMRRDARNHLREEQIKRAGLKRNNGGNYE